MSAPTFPIILMCFQGGFAQLLTATAFDELVGVLRGVEGAEDLDFLAEMSMRRPAQICHTQTTVHIYTMQELPSDLRHKLRAAIGKYINKLYSGAEA